MNRSRSLSFLEMSRFNEHMRKRARAPIPWLLGMTWSQARASARAFDHPHPAAAIDAYERGEIASYSDLKIITTAIALTGDHRRFEGSVLMFDPAITYPPGDRRRRFAGAGIGAGSLNVFRTLTRDGESLFEKTYQREDACFRHMSFFHENVLPRLEGVKFPALREIAAGDRLAVTYFEQVPYKRPAQYDIEAAARLVHTLAAHDFSDLAVPDLALDFRRRGVNHGRHLISRKLNRNDPARAARILADLEHWDAIIAEYPRVLTHADLNQSNISTDGHVIDWDTAGFFPYGYDAAYAAHFSGTPLDDLDALNAFYRQYFERPDATREDWLAFLFFFMHFMHIGRRPRRNGKLFRAARGTLKKAFGQAPEALRAASAGRSAP